MLNIRSAWSDNGYPIEKYEDIVKLPMELCKHLGNGIWWRGQSVSTWNLVPGIYRECHDKNYERTIISQFMRKAPSRHLNCPTDKLEWLFLMRHYGLHTRLLDWTESPLIALFFAVYEAEHDGEDAILWGMNPFILNDCQVNIRAVPGELRDIPDVSSIVKAAFEPENESSKNSKIIAIYPPQRDIRMLVQQSAVTLHGTCTPLEELEEKRRILAKIIIPSDMKQMLRDNLSSLGIRLSTIFPDLEHLAFEINKSIQ